MSNNFKQYGFPAWMQKALADMQYKQLTPVQHKTIKPFLGGKDLIVQAPTGTGKTCAFAIPICQALDASQKGVQALVLSPTRELAVQTAAAFKQLTRHRKDIRIAVLYGGENIGKQMASMRRKPHIVIATPGRLMDHMNRRSVKLESVNTVVLDEADRMLDMGFRHDMAKILGATPQRRQTVLFSATISKEITKISQSYQHNALKITIPQQTMTAATIEQYYTKVPNGKKAEELATILNDGRNERVLVFVNTKRKADKLARSLVKKGYSTCALHGDMSQPQRDRAMKQYRQGKVNILVATDVAARGIDVDNIDAVVNYDLPQDSESYVHRIGRTGRAENKGIAYTFIAQGEMDKLRAMMKVTKADIKKAV